MAAIYVETAMILIVALSFPLSYIVAEYSEREIKNLTKKFTDSIFIPVFAAELALFALVMSLLNPLIYAVSAALVVFNLFIFALYFARKWDFARSILFFLMFIIIEFVIAIIV
ncbi:hypothetical protein IHE50_00810 [Candidatus Parvarchaeota archaeon]|uniref:Uncharacterized protein n=1 Tax=Candidatus Acidifodinimicrobium mancum TaxID=2898728 RepID=A0A8T3UPZ2_9ARCH|nr:hypothetical protein [Candidatus Acidifodinimicrobium mancum]